MSGAPQKEAFLSEVHQPLMGGNRSERVVERKWAHSPLCRQQSHIPDRERPSSFHRRLTAPPARQHQDVCQATHTPTSRLCFLDTLWFFGLMDSLCLAALLSSRAMARGMASRLTLSMVPAEERCLLGRDGLTGATYSGD